MRSERVGQTIQPVCVERIPDCPAHPVTLSDHGEFRRSVRATVNRGCCRAVGASKAGAHVVSFVSVSTRAGCPRAGVVSVAFAVELRSCASARGRLTRAVRRTPRSVAQFSLCSRHRCPIHTPLSVTYHNSTHARNGHLGTQGAGNFFRFVPRPVPHLCPMPRHVRFRGLFLSRTYPA